MQRRRIEVRGIVQGVGFRPHVYALARRLGLGGFVQNRQDAVRIEVEGEAATLDRFVHELQEHPPARARVDAIQCQLRSMRGEHTFAIRDSEAVSGGTAPIGPDVAVCSACVAELFDPANRRHRYPFISCAECGPRLTIVISAPYDRVRTTLRSFSLCQKCQAEYDDPNDRRFHAQTIACEECGPRVALYDNRGETVEAADPLAGFVAALRQGRIGAIKGLGGYHLCCDAGNAAVVETLRLRKQRDEKPLAIMVADLTAAERICKVSLQEKQLLGSPQSPIVLLQRNSATQAAIADAVAPGNPELGVMLPYTPLHHLLLRAMTPSALVLTSGNRSDEPIAYQDDNAFTRLSGIADLLLAHDRPIHVRCDDSVARIVAREISPLRRSRGFAPSPISLPFASPRPILAVGGQLKSVFALGSGSNAFLSHHLGDLDDLETYRAFERDLSSYQGLLGIEPQVIAHDLHPDYASTRYAVASGLPAVAVQHHHAHLASCLAEHGEREPAIGVTFDGAGLGTDGAIWGGEFLVGDYTGFRRAAHLRYVPMPGGELAAREPWRMAAAHLIDANCSLDCLQPHVPLATLQMTATMLERKINSPLTSSMGRLFDAVAAMTGVRLRSSYEGQAAMELQWLAARSSDSGVDSWEPVERGESQCLVLDTRPLIRQIAGDMARGVPPAVVARRFHRTVVQWILQVCRRIRFETGLQKVALTGGVFHNQYLATEAASLLAAENFVVYTHHQVPAGDGGLSLGQLAVAAHRPELER